MTAKGFAPGLEIYFIPLGGCSWPLFITPESMQTLAKLTPYGWANLAFNKLMLFGVGFLAIAFVRFRLSPSVS